LIAHGSPPASATNACSSMYGSPMTPSISSLQCASHRGRSGAHSDRTLATDPRCAFPTLPESHIRVVTRTHRSIQHKCQVMDRRKGAGPQRETTVSGSRWSISPLGQSRTSRPSWSAGCGCPHPLRPMLSPSVINADNNFRSRCIGHALAANLRERRRAGLK
jgi:hypothetical protein